MIFHLSLVSTQPFNLITVGKQSETRVKAYAVYTKCSRAFLNAKLVLCMMLCSGQYGATGKMATSDYSIVYFIIEDDVPQVMKIFMI